MTAHGRGAATADGVIWDAVAAARLHFVETVADLERAAWDRPSMCEGWTMRHVVAHLVMGHEASTPRLAAALVRARFDFDRLSRTWALNETRSGGELISALGRHAWSGWTGPGGSAANQLIEILVHSADVLLPLGLPLVPVCDAHAEALAMLASKRAERGYVRRGALDGVRLVPTDLAWSGKGESDLVGPAALLASAACGRRASLARLSGPAVPIVQERLR